MVAALFAVCLAVDCLVWQAEDLRKLVVEAADNNREEFARQAAPLLAAGGKTPNEVKQLLGSPQRVSRQMVYRRLVEQWIYDRPLPLCIVWQSHRGQETQILSVHPLSNAKQ
jgi:hypothetical protein